MAKETKILIATIIGLFVVLLSMLLLWLYLPFYTTARQVARYSGDGEIRDITLTFLTLPIPGYAIEFEVFPLDTPFSKSYTLKNLPVLDTNTPLLYFRAYKQRHNREIGVISMRITDKEGNALVAINNIPASKFIWSHAGRNPFDDLYLLPDSKFAPKKGEIYMLEVDFTPAAPNAPGAEPAIGGDGALYIRAGGSI